ncbi:hypothetical protein K1719_036326 [Acacia pycnantha]|nr:hypothetical protein K1719_036326 [Acacia pycnantha]
MKCMHEKLVQQGRIEDFGFLCPVCGFDLKDPKWYQPKTRRQPPESNLCGPYVMKHIYDIVTEGKTKFAAKRFACEKPFDDDEVEHIRHVFCEYLYKLVLENLSQDNN